MTDSYRMSDMCAMCGERYGQHVGLSCCNSRGSFFLAAKPANGPESYHYRAGLNDYFTRAAEQANRLVFPSGAAVLTSGDKIVGRVSGTLTGVKVTVGAGGYSGVTLVSGGGSGGSGRAEPTQTEADVSQAIETILNSPMKRRDNLPPAPLPHFNQRTEFDAFPDYVVFHEFEPVAPLHTSPTTDSAYPAIAGLLRG